MNKNWSDNNLRKGECLRDEDLYRYISGDSSREALDLAQSHFSECPHCRRNLAELLEILDPDSEKAAGGTELAKPEIDRTLTTIQEVALRERPRKTRPLFKMPWAIAAAIVLGFTCLSVVTFKYLYEKNKSEAFLRQATAMLEQNYTGTSPSNLRLALPFQSTVVTRKSTGSELLQPAETLFFQALAVREKMAEPHLGLGYIYLTESKFSRAKEEFQSAMKVRGDDVHALIGRGVAQYEEALQGADPLQRHALLSNALDDFDTVLKRSPGSLEARYNKIWALFESGQHKEASREIEIYLTRDSDSIWAQELKSLKIRIVGTSTRAIEDEIIKAASERDPLRLTELAQQASYQMPVAIWSALIWSIAPEQVSVAGKSASSVDFRWAAKIMEEEYGRSTGDHSFKEMINFYGGLSPPQIRIKRNLDKQLQDSIQLLKQGKYDAASSLSKPLELQYLQIKDFWQLIDLHNLRGESLYMGRADFVGTEAEFREVCRIAERLNSPYLLTKALKALAGIQVEQSKFDQALMSIERARDLAKKHRLKNWQASASLTLGNQYRILGKLELAGQEYADTLNMAYPLADGLKVLQCLENFAIVLDRLGRRDEAAEYYRLALQQQNMFVKEDVLRQGPALTLYRANLLYKRGDLAFRVGELGQAEEFFKKSLESSWRGTRELECRNRVGLAEVYLKTRDIPNAQAVLKPALSIVASGQYPEIEWQAKFVEGRVFEEKGKPREALRCYEESVQMLERMRKSARAGEFRQSFLNNRYDPFRAIVSLLFHSGEKGKLLEFLDAAKAKTLKENLKNAEFDAEFRPDAVREGTDAFPIIEYFFARGELLILATEQNNIEVFVQKISAEEVDRQIKIFLSSAKKGDSREFTAIARSLYDRLIRPAERYVAHNKSGTLVVLPDGPLYHLPFAGLLDSSGHFLIENTAIAYAPSRGLFQHCLLAARGASAASKNVLLIDGAKGLPNAQKELAYISRLYGKGASILGAKDLPISARALQRSAILHFSGHAAIRNGQPVLLLQRFPNEISIGCSTIRNWKMPAAKLVNLAGCSTGLGPAAEGESPWGLIPAFLDAGAPAVIASLMDVDDASASVLSRELYDRLQEGIGIAEALQRAQVALLHSSRSDTDAGPLSWIPYVLVGSPQY